MIGSVITRYGSKGWQKTTPVIAVFFMLIALLATAPVQAQSFHFFQYKLPYGEKDSVNSIAFLTIYANGSSSCRVKYKDPVTDEMQLLETCYADSVIQHGGWKAQPRKVLIPGEACFLEGNPQRPAIMPSFVFSEVKDSTGRYYEPTVLLYPTGKGWGNTLLLQNRTFTFQDIDRQLVGLFYNENEPFYKNLFRTDTRSLSKLDSTTVMHLIVVANTLDPKIGASCRLDMFNVTGTFDELCSRMGIKMRLTTISGKSFGKSSVQKALQNLRVRKNDIIIFYYSGHGYRTPQTKGKFPMIDLTTSLSQPLAPNSMHMKAIYDSIVKKGARLNLVFSDCCNEKIGAIKPEGGEMLRTRSAGLPLSIDNCKALFFSPVRTSVLATSADIDQYASGNPDIGGFFSWHLRTSLQNHTSRLKSNVNWIQVLNEARVNTAEQAITAICKSSRCIQYPWFEIKR